MEFALLFYIPLCIIIGVAAHCRCRRDGTGWTVLACLISPLLAGLLLIAMGPKPLTNYRYTTWHSRRRDKLTGKRTAWDVDTRQWVTLPPRNEFTYERIET